MEFMQGQAFMLVPFYFQKGENLDVYFKNTEGI